MTEPAKKTGLYPLLFSAGVCIFLAVLSIPARPLFPVDETRYLTVAWEMFSRQDWVLPTLNHEAYHHKPPLLFWLIMSLWGIFGVSQQVAQIVPFIAAFAVSAALIRMVRVMAPDRPGLPLLASALLLGSLPFVLYSQMIMFDVLLSVFAVIGLTSVWQFATTGQPRHILIFGLAVGLGVLAKGPVILLHVLFPVVLAAIWIPKDRRLMNWGKWSISFMGGILIGATIALSWAIPAAIKGGPEFTEKIFWGQTAGRMTNSFDHKAPVWWYLSFLPLFLLPWIFHPASWQGLKILPTAAQPMLARFLACWLIPVFISFSLISGKQVHYLLPLLPGVIFVFALALDGVAATRRSAFPALIAMGICAALTLLPGILSLLPLSEIKAIEDRAHLQGSFDKMSLPVSLGGTALIAGLAALFARRSLSGQIAGITLAMMVFIGCFQIQAARSFYGNYDLRPIAAIVAAHPGTPLAFARNYHGEWGFLARLDRPVKQVELEDLPEWFKQNPEGMAFIRTSRPAEFTPYDIIFSMPYKMTNTYAVVVRKGKGVNFPDYRNPGIPD